MLKTLSRTVVAAVAATTALVIFPALPGNAHSPDLAPATAPAVAELYASSAATRAYAHLDLALDRNGTEGPRMPSSFNISGELSSYDTAHVYDVALAVVAYLARGTDEDIRRARDMGDAFLAVQAADPYDDGRVRNGYDPTPLFTPTGVPNIDSRGSATGNMAWTGLALVKLYVATGDHRYLDGATRLAGFIARSRSWDGPGGFTGGWSSSGYRITWKSTEHNIDAAAFYTQLYYVTGTRKYWTLANSARNFVRRMWDSTNQRFVVGTYDDGVTLNLGDNPVEDVQSWGNLLFRGETTYRGALAWAREALQVTDEQAGVTGMKFAAGEDPSNTVWIEGTAHMMLAMRRDGSYASQSAARLYRESLIKTQLEGENGNGLGLISASHRGTAGGDDDVYPSLHVGTTAWFILAELNVNPFAPGLTN